MILSLAALLLAGVAPTQPRASARVAADGRVSFAFSARERGTPSAKLRFRCAVDAQRLRVCRSPYVVRLTSGVHSFRVQALDPRGRRSSFRRIRVTVGPPSSVAVGSQPVSLTFGGGSLWTADWGGGTVTRVDPQAARKQATIRIGGAPGGIAYANGSAWVGNFDETIGISQIDPGPNTVAGHIDIGGQPVGLLADGTTLWVADYKGFVDRVDVSTKRVVARIAVGGNPEALALAFGLLWVTNFDGTLSTIDPSTNTVSGPKIAGDSDMDAVAIGPDAVWATSFNGGTLLRIDPATHAVTKRVQLGGQGAGVLVFGG